MSCMLDNSQKILPAFKPPWLERELKFLLIGGTISLFRPRCLSETSFSSQFLEEKVFFFCTNKFFFVIP